MVVRAAMIYGFERLALIKRHMTKLKGPAGTGLAMSISEGQLDQLEQLEDNVRDARKKWFRNVQSRDSGYTRPMILKMELPDRRKWKTGRFMEVYGSRLRRARRGLT